MKRPKTFAELASYHPSAWPTQDRKLLTWDGQMEPALIGGEKLSWFSALSHGYKRAADILVEQATEGRGHPNFLVYPILFLYRHFIELSLKGLLASCGPLANIQPVWNSHDLCKLWKLLTQALDHHEIPNDASRKTVGAQIQEFSRFDPNSEAARYHLDAKGRPIVLNITQLDLKQLERGMDGLEAYFVYLIENTP